MSPRPESLAAIRARYLAAGVAAPPRLVARLAADPRPGAQTLARALKARRSACRSAANRFAAMLHFERLLWQAGIEHVAGIDEVGVGPLAGPVVAAAVVLPRDIDLGGIDDSKQLDAATRERLAVAIEAAAVAVSVAAVDVDEIDKLNIYNAGLEAMRRAVLGLAVSPQHLLVDARHVPGLPGLPQNAFTRGDGLNYSIACASIVAKVWRDRRMCELDRIHPGYGFARHKGYGTAEHLRALACLGPSPIHRQSFPVLAQIAGDATPGFYQARAAIAAAPTLPALAAAAEQVRALAATIPGSELRKLQALVGRRRGAIERRRQPERPRGPWTRP